MYVHIQEAFEYIGSARVLYDMLEGKFPYRSHRESHRDWALHRIIPENIGTYIELSQLGLSEENKLWMHTDPVSRAADPGIDAAVRTGRAKYRVYFASLKYILSQSSTWWHRLTQFQYQYTMTHQ